MALIADIANNTGQSLASLRIFRINARSIQSSSPHPLIPSFLHVMIHGPGLPILGDVRHHFEIRVLAPRSQPPQDLGNIQ